MSFSHPNREHGESGIRLPVDVTLIDAMLALTPEERLRQNDRVLHGIQELRDGFAARPHDPARRPGDERR